MELTPVTSYTFPDLMTGETVAVDGTPTPLTLKVGDVEYGPIYLGQVSADALTALFKEDGEAFRETFTRTKPKTNRSGERDEETNATSAEIRQWANDNGIAVNARARIPNDVRGKFREAVKSGAYTVKDTGETPTETPETPATPEVAPEAEKTPATRKR